MPSQPKHDRKSPKIVTHHVYPPIPIRTCDWVAAYDDYEGGDGYSEPAGPTGLGATEAEAIRNLMADHPRSGNPCQSCGRPFFDGDTCGMGGCPMGGDL